MILGAATLFGGLAVGGVILALTTHDAADVPIRLLVVTGIAVLVAVAVGVATILDRGRSVGRRGRRPGRRSISPATWTLIVGATTGVHALLVGFVDSHSLFIRPLDRDQEQGDVSVAELVNYSCELEAAAASAVHFAGCATPFAGDRQDCAREAIVEQRLAYLSCRQPAEVSVAMVDLDKIEPLPILPVEPVDDIVAAQLLEQEIIEKIEEAQKQIQRPPAAGQVVEITRPRVESQPERARYLSEYDSQVEKQTVARGSTEEMVERPAPRELPVEPDPKERPQEVAEKAPEETLPQERATDDPGKGEGEQKGMLAMRGAGSADRRPSEAREAGELDGTQEISPDGIEGRRGDGARRSERSELEPEGGGGGDGGATKKRPDLTPSEETMARVAGGGSVDKIDDAESGDFTALNSRKWKYASFFNRLKRRVAQSWHPDKVYLRRDPTGKVYGQKDRITVLRVSLDPSGALAKVYIQKQSGVDFLDDEAVRAFREAGPFPNPPRALVEDGLITFSFGFHFQIGGRPDSWRIFRYR